MGRTPRMRNSGNIQNSDLLFGKLLKRYQDRHNSLFGERIEWDDNFLHSNLRDKFRPYQAQTLEFFHDTQSNSKREENFRHLLFNMATGAGKTMIMASTILYLFKEHGYRNFLFFVHTDGILQKTIDNLLNKSSSKYLFTQEIEIDGHIIHIKAVESFPKVAEENTIYLKMSTIHKLHIDLNNPKENSLTYSDLVEYPVVMLADEAHHYNAVTQNTNAKKDEARAWESTIARIYKSHPENMLLEFTATIDLTNEQIFEKYKDKILQKYDLKQFMEDGYSKKVYLLQINQDDRTKMLDAVLLSQYRKFVAIKHGIRGFKPVVMFKSNTVDISLKSHEDFNMLIQNLSIDDIEQHLRSKMFLMAEKPQSVWNAVTAFYLDGDLNLLDVLETIKNDFQNKNIINANSKEFLDGDNFKILNTLEDKNNPIRVIFAVAKLSEGWDVLNLYDIVRISERAATTENSTNQEAQLIGRGARYYPFVYKQEKAGERRFDNSLLELTILEQLHYHTINEASYINNLNASLVKEDISFSTDGLSKVYSAKIKESFKNHELYQFGKIYLNRTVKLDDSKRTFESYSIGNEIIVSYKIADESTLNDIKSSNSILHSGQNIHLESLSVPKQYIQKAIQRLMFFRFDNLSIYFPKLHSIDEFIQIYLANTAIKVCLPTTLSIRNLSAQEKLHLVEVALGKIADNLRKNYAKAVGSKRFYGAYIRDHIKNYEILVDDNPNNNLTQMITSKSMMGKKWYVYDNALLNQLEHNLLTKMDDVIKKLQSRYSDVYLIRNDERTSNFKLVEFGGVRGFMPDFLLLLSDKSENRFYQVFLEPKGEPYYTQDKWKEDMLARVNESDIVLEEGDNVRLIGVRFYREANDGNTDYALEFFNDLADKVNNGESLVEKEPLFVQSKKQDDLFG